MALKLHVSRSGAGPPVVLLHGLFGAGGNLGALARALQDRFEVCSVDLPNHGRSEWSPQTDLAGMALHLLEWMDDEALNAAAIVGHSLGGKVAMQLALEQPARVSALVVADIAPVAYPPQHDAVFAALQAVASAQCRSRKDAAELMHEYLEEPEVIQFLLTSLQRDAEGIYRWRFNLDGLRTGYHALRSAPVFGQAYDGPTLFIKGGESGYIQEQHRALILDMFPLARVKVMPDCGHWLHAQQPRLFNGIVNRFLQAQFS